MAVKPHRCPYLGLKEDPSTALNFPSAGNLCHKPASPTPIKQDYQQAICLTSQHVRCPVYLAAAGARVPRKIQGTAAPARRSARALAFIAAPLLLFLLVGLALALNSRYGWLNGASGISVDDRAVRETTGFRLFPSGDEDASLPDTIPNTSIQPTRAACPRPAEWVTYEVLPTDSLYRLSVLYGVSVSELQEVNCLGDETAVTPGQLLYVPFSIAGIQSPANPALPGSQPGGAPALTFVPPRLGAITPIAPTPIENTGGNPPPPSPTDPPPPTAIPATATLTSVPPTGVPPSSTATVAPPTLTSVPPTGVPPTGVPPTATMPPVPTGTPVPQPTSAPPTQPPPTPIDDNNDIISTVCDNETVTVSGNKLTLDLTGVCDVIVTGNNNRITVSAGTDVDDRGNNNVIVVR